MNHLSNDEEDNMQITNMIAHGKIKGFHPFGEESEDEHERATRKPNKRNNFVEKYNCFRRFYFHDNCIYSERDFECRFSMSRNIFNKIEETITGRREFKYNQQDTTGKTRILPRNKLLFVLRIFAYGLSFDQVDALCEMSTPTKRAAFIYYFDIIHGSFASQYLRTPNTEYLKSIVEINERRVFPGSIRSWD